MSEEQPVVEAAEASEGEPTQEPSCNGRSSRQTPWGRYVEDAPPFNNGGASYFNNYSESEWKVCLKYVTVGLAIYM
jgi:hypothetical protein